MDVHFSSKTDMWSTPKKFFEELNKEFHFTLDPCATAENATCEKFYTEEDNGLIQNWDGETVFMNPPYGREIGKWVRKAVESRGGVVVMLLPARTCTRWFHDYIYNNKKCEIRLLKGRLKFGDAKASAPFPSMIVIYKDL